MRIAQVAPLMESCPPKLYGGTERVVSFLTEELVRQGHEVSLFASGDSRTAARLVAPCPQALRLNSGHPDPVAWHLVMLEQVAARADQFEIIHFHIDFLHFPLFSRLGQRIITTQHGRLDLPHLERLFKQFPGMPVVSISDAQRTPLPHAAWAATIHHGLPEKLYQLGRGAGGYLLFLGRICPEKGIEDAIEIALRAGVPLKIAAKIDRVDEDYFNERVRARLSEPMIEFLGEVDDGGKNALLGDALGVLFPIRWPEPFGLVMIEAMAAGTPIIAYPLGSVPEIIELGRSGVIVDGIEQAVSAVALLPQLDRKRVRACFEARFTVGRMAEAYADLYLSMMVPDADLTAVAA